MSGMYSSSPAVAVAEEVAAGWALELLGLPGGAAVGFVSGAQMANFSCLAAARGELLRRAGQDDEARRALTRALELVHSDAERRLLERRLEELGG